MLCSTASVTVAFPSATSGEAQLLHDRVEILLSGMSLEEKIGQLFIISADGDLENQIRRHHIGGVVLFSRHTSTLPQTMRFIEQIRKSAPLPPFIAIDQEGGRISRLSFATSIPNSRSLGTLSGAALQNIGKLVGRELRALGFNLNFAPVLDVDTCTDNPVIGDRSFNSNPYEVARLGSSYIRGLHNSGILAAAKHFPGHGDTRKDSHYELPVVNQSQERIDSVEVLPFRAAILSGVEMIMTAHVHYPALDATPNWPATLSKPILTGLLRQELGFRGIIITDAMNMKAITGLGESGQTAKSALLAGVDIILMPDHMPSAYNALLSAVKDGEIPVARVDESVRRILALKLRLPKEAAHSFDEKLKYAVGIVGSPAHRRWIEQAMNGALLLTEPSGGDDSR